MERSSSSSICPTTRLKKGEWTPEEDSKLKDYINQYGVPLRNWTQVPAKAGLSRCRKSCRFRWMNYLRPIIKRGNYTKEEDVLIIYLRIHLKFGWAKIAYWLPRRTDCDIKNHWHTKLNKNAKPIKEKRKPERAGGIKRSRVGPNNTTTVILESSVLPLVSATKSLPSLSTQNSEGSTSSPVPPTNSLLPSPNANSKDKELWVLEEAIVDPSPFSNDMSSSVLEECWDLPIENVEMLVSPSILPHTIENQPFCDLSSDAEEYMNSQYWMSGKSSCPVWVSFENQDIGENSQVSLQGSDEPPVSPTLSSMWGPEKFSSMLSISPEEFTFGEEFSCFSYLHSFVSLFQNSLNSVVSLFNFKKGN